MTKCIVCGKTIEPAEELCPSCFGFFVSVCKRDMKEILEIMRYFRKNAE